MKIFSFVVLVLLATPVLGADCEQPDLFERLDCQLRVTRKAREIAQEEQALQQLRGADTVSSDLSLLRVYGRPGALTAQFSRGRTVFTAGRGDAVTEGCIISDISATGVRTRCDDGQMQTLRLGARADRAPASNAAATPVVVPVDAQQPTQTETP